MASLALASRGGYNPAMRGYLALYRAHEVNHCPGCGRTHWLVGRMLAECAFCATAIPLEEGDAPRGESATIIRRGKGGGKVR